MNMVVAFGKYGTKTILGERIIEGNLAYIQQEKGDNVTVVTANGISKTMPIGELEEFINDYPMHSDIREELEILSSKVLKE
jgi:hypothetical protein